MLFSRTLFILWTLKQEPVLSLHSMQAHTLCSRLWKYIGTFYDLFYTVHNMTFSGTWTFKISLYKSVVSVVNKYIILPWWYNFILIVTLKYHQSSTDCRLNSDYLYRFPKGLPHTRFFGFFFLIKLSHQPSIPVPHIRCLTGPLFIIIL